MVPIKDRMHEPMKGSDSRQVRKMLLDYAMDEGLDAADIKNPTQLAKALIPRLAEADKAFEGVIAGNQSWVKSAARESLIGILKDQLKAGPGGGKAQLQKKIDQERQERALYESSAGDQDEEAVDPDDEPRTKKPNLRSNQQTPSYK